MYGKIAPLFVIKYQASKKIVLTARFFHVA